MSVQRGIQHAGRRPSVALPAPALTSHMIFLIKEDDNPLFANGDDEYVERWNKLIAHVNNLITKINDAVKFKCELKFVRRFDPFEHKASVQKRDSLFFQDRVSSEIVGGDFDARLRLDINTEVVTVTFGTFNFHQGSIAAKNLGALLRSDYFGCPDENEEQRTKSALEFLYIDFWKPISDIVREFMISISYPLLSEFRSIILNLHDEDLPLYPQPDHIDAPSRRKARRRAQEADLAPHAPFHLSSGGVAVHSAIQGYMCRKHSLIDQVATRSFMSSDEAPDKHAPKITENVVCAMLGGKALYVSSLSGYGEGQDFLCILIGFAGRSQAQLGRFMRRLHMQGELRVSALIDYDKWENPGPSGGSTTSKDIERAAQVVFNATKALNDLDALICHTTNEPHGVPPKLARKSDLQSGLQSQTSYNAINLSNIMAYGIAEKTNELLKIREHLEFADNMVSGGLQLRCARSVYYANLFKDKLQDLGVVPLEHYQSYDAFMRRYVYQLWDRVSIVGSTYTSCVAKLSEMMDRIESQRTQIRSENLTIIGTVGGVLVISR